MDMKKEFLALIDENGAAIASCRRMTGLTGMSMKMAIT